MDARVIVRSPTDPNGVRYTFPETEPSGTVIVIVLAMRFSRRYCCVRQKTEFHIIIEFEYESSLTGDCRESNVAGDPGVVSPGDVIAI